MTLSLLDILALLFGLSALFGYINHLFFKLPHTIGLMIVALLASGAIVLWDVIMPGLAIGETVRSSLTQLDFHDVLMEGFLSALLFAGAVHVNLADLAKQKWVIGLMATIGVLMSTFIVGTIMWVVGGLLGFDIPYIWWLIFGALISPTDPVAVLGVFKNLYVPASLKAKITGESLFNDGVGVVVFTILVALAGASSHGAMTGTDVAVLFIQEAVGGILLGLVFGYLAFVMMRTLDEHNLEVLITLALVTCTYALALHLHLSGPIAVVVAGLLIGNHGARDAMSDNTRQHVFQFWTLSDEILNSVLFLLIGLEVLVLSFTFGVLTVGLVAIPVVLFARWVAVAGPITLLSLRHQFTPGAIKFLSWGGLRGGISVALALSLPKNEFQPVLLTATYIVVIFSIIVQGLTIERLLRSIVGDKTETEFKEAPH